MSISNTVAIFGNEPSEWWEHVFEDKDCLYLQSGIT
jgi:hypothetical protein